MKMRWTPISFLLLMGCDAAEIQGCEDFVKDGLRSPSSYRRVSANVSDEKLTVSNYESATGEKIRDDLERRVIDRGSKHIRRVSISYDADNAFGTSVRGKEICAFKVYGEESLSSTSIKASVLNSTASRSFRQFARSGGLPSLPAEQAPAEPLYACCM